ncbi:hypothetical protein BC834DRAFT_907647 [Gloeopeniophorella convolvens]|nr:hypothetical protein BC834DRAFT_907647 [Gloeopeniophorella convolvens]
MSSTPPAPTSVEESPTPTPAPAYPPQIMEAIYPMEQPDARPSSTAAASNASTTNMHSAQPQPTQQPYIELAGQNRSRSPPLSVPIHSIHAYGRTRGVSYADSGVGLTIMPEDAVMPARGMTVGERLQPTIDEAIHERDKAAWTAKWTELSINIAIGLQVILGALTTVLGASLNKAESIRASIAVLGSLSTLVAAYTARTRGSSEPEASLVRSTALGGFLREILAFKLDHEHEVGHEQDAHIESFRIRLDHLLRSTDGKAGVVAASEAINPTSAGP